MSNQHRFTTQRHGTSYREAGPSDGRLLVFVHGWPELGSMWARQLEYFAERGWRVVAPDMRGYGNSTVHPALGDYRMEEVVADLLELLSHLGAGSATWVGHDWGAPAVWSLASHHPQACDAIANLCVPYLPAGFAPANLVPLVNREIYPLQQFPAGQWDYQFEYFEHFDASQKAFEADLRKTFKAFIRSGNPAGAGKPSPTASVRTTGGWFGGRGSAPDTEMDPKTLTEAMLAEFVDAFARTGFFGANAWYMNADANIEYAKRSVNGGRLAMPVLFLHAAYDWICDTTTSKLAEPMRAACSRLDEATLMTGHWMVQEAPDEVNRHLDAWLHQGRRQASGLPPQRAAEAPRVGGTERPSAACTGAAPA